MKLLTLNCHSWQEENQIEKIKYIAKTINEKDYDVIALQEVSQLIEKDKVYENVKSDNFALLLQNELKNLGNNQYEFYWDVAHIGYDIYEEGLCLMTKLPIVNKESFYITNSIKLDFWKTRKIVGIDVIYKSKEIRFLSCHLGWWNDNEEPFKEQIKRLINETDNEKLVFLMGDFNNNANIKGEGYDYLCNKFFDTYKLSKVKDEGITVKGKIAGWDDNKLDLRLDLILSNKEIDVESSNVIFNGINKKVVSDHYGVEVCINVK
ncbi:endonuclease/exonuclease/phosphatase family protein [Paraclostridium sordellii]|uniref:endonuclease/exonuclease/phosphatase family protein n=1 Tax=Paraclostridium sordellii TaxID=1505 RepID=UPI0005E06178|nr:endonuclease/exonuclease/phosphatase family protein [Paeniclostridium sordellii]CEP80112.1 endonuclease/exonuclease/phosphatase family protein [[Clostridium] sordellii] [Paeniclostridium sordellii]